MVGSDYIRCNNYLTLTKRLRDRHRRTLTNKFIRNCLRLSPSISLLYQLKFRFRSGQLSLEESFFCGQFLITHNSPSTPF